MPQTSTRRTQTDRSMIMRNKLAKAAFELIRDRSFANFRVASVAELAGVSQGGQLHHFPTKDLMSLAAIEYGIRLAREVTEHNFDHYNPKEDVIAAITADCHDYYFSASFDVAMDVSKGSADNPALTRQIARRHREYRRFAEDGWLDIMVEQGWEETDASDVIAMTASLVRGFAIRTMMRPGSHEGDRLMVRWQQMVHQSFGSPDRQL